MLSSARTRISVSLRSVCCPTRRRTIRRTLGESIPRVLSPLETMDDDLSIHTSRDGSTAIVAASGEIDLSTVGELRVAVTDAASDCDRLRLDLSGVEFIDSTGLGGLLELRSTLRARSVTLEIVAGDGPVRQAVEITGLGELLATG